MNSFTRIGFILAASGSAVGLGNIWKFPYMVGQYGGSAFVLVYLLTIIFVGFSVLVAEIFIGYKGQANAVDSFDVLTPSNTKIKWKYAGFSAFTGLIVMTFYNVVIGWILYYLVHSLFLLPSTVEDAKNTFNTLITTKIYYEIFFHLLTTLFIGYILLKGVKNGIEKTNKILMPLLILIVLSLLFYSMTLDGFGKAISFMFTYDSSKLNSQAIVQAVGHSFFTLSIGMAAIMTYASSLKANTNIFKASIYIVILDTFIAIVSGIMLYAFVFEFGQDPSSGPGLVFISLPFVFAKLGLLGTIFAILFFLALAFAGITSAISLVEPSVTYCIHRFEISRIKAISIISTIIFIFGILTLLSYSKDFGDSFTFFGLPLFDLFDKLSTNILIPLGGLIVAIFVGFVVKKEKIHSVFDSYISIRVLNIWYFTLRYIAIPSLIFMLLNLIGVVKI